MSASLTPRTDNTSDTEGGPDSALQTPSTTTTPQAVGGASSSTGQQENGTGAAPSFSSEITNPEKLSVRDQLVAAGYDGKLPPLIKDEKINKIMETDPPNEQELECMEFLKNNLSVQPLEDDDNFFSKGDDGKSTYLRFTRARECKKEKALKMMETCLEWRREYKPHLITLDTITDILGMGTVFQMGVCREGRAILYMTPGKTNSFGADKRIQLLVFLLENTCRQGFDQLTWVFDWSQFGDRGRDEESTKTRELALTVLQDYYPERLGKLLMVDTPWYYSLLYSIASVFMAARTTKKIHNVKNKYVNQHVEPKFLLKMFREGERDPPIRRMTESEMPTMQ